MWLQAQNYPNLFHLFALLPASGAQTDLRYVAFYESKQGCLSRIAPRPSSVAGKSI
jgi:hypothetical protein